MSNASETESLRLEKEKQFHDERFADDTLRHSKVTKYYAIADSLFADYQAALMSNCKDQHVVEYGCGTGSQGFTLAEHGARVTGIDISSVAIAQASKMAAGKNTRHTPEFLEMNAEELQFEDNSVDKICGSSILHHLDLQKSMSEISRVLKPGGTAVFIEPLGHNPIINLYRYLTPKLRTDDEHPLTSAELKAITSEFSSSNIKYYYILSLIASGVHGTPLFKPALAVFGTADKLLLKIGPVKKYAWFSCIHLVK